MHLPWFNDLYDWVILFCHSKERIWFDLLRHLFAASICYHVTFMDLSLEWPRSDPTLSIVGLHYVVLRNVLSMSAAFSTWWCVHEAWMGPVQEDDVSACQWRVRPGLDGSSLDACMRLEWVQPGGWRVRLTQQFWGLIVNVYIGAWRFHGSVTRCLHENSHSQCLVTGVGTAPLWINCPEILGMSWDINVVICQRTTTVLCSSCAPWDPQTATNVARCIPYFFCLCLGW